MILRPLLVVSCLFAAAAPLCAQDAPAAKKDVRPAGRWYGIEKALPKKPGALRLACYNAENLFDGFDDPALSGEWEDMKEETRPERVQAVADTIRALDADILCLEEIESEHCLRWLRDNYLADLGYEYIASLDAGYYRGVEQSVLSRVPIKAARVYEGEDRVISDMEPRRTPEAAKRLNGTWAAPGKGAPPEKFQRSPLRVDLETADGYALTVFVVHFKAGRDFDHHRELEALQVEQFVEEELAKNPDANIAVLGDFNGTPSDMNVKALRMSDDGLVSAYDWRFDKDASKDTYSTHASGRAIDFIVMTPGLAADCVDASYFVLGTLHAASDWDWRKADEIPPPIGYASDHYPVAIDVMPKPDRPASAFKRAVVSEEPSAPRRPWLRSDATPPTSGDLEEHAKPKGSPSRGDEALAAKLREAGWEYVLPSPKSKTAKWSVKGGNSTWWPGFWWNAKTGDTSKSQPEAKDTFKGDGKPAPSGKDWKSGGAPGPVSWVEWLCSEVGGR